MPLDPYSVALARSVAVLGAVAPDIDSTPGSLLFDLLRAQAQAIADVLYTLQTVQNQASAVTASGQYLDNLAADAGLGRLGQVAASGQVTVTAQAGAPGGQVVIPAGARVWTDPSSANDGAPLFYDLQAQLVVPSPGSASGLVVCETGGTLGNAALGAIVHMDPYDYVAAGGVTNGAAFTSGQDAETDDALRVRIQQARDVAYAAAAIESAAEAALGTGGLALVSDPKDGSGRATLYGAAADGTLPTALQAAVAAATANVLPITTSVVTEQFPMVFAALSLAIVVPSGYAGALTASAVAAQAVLYAQTLAAGATFQPAPFYVWCRQAIPAMAAAGSDLYLTSPTTPPTVAATSLFRFLAPPTPPTLAGTTGGSLAGTIYVVCSYTTASGDTLPCIELSLTLAGGSTAATVTTGPAPFSAVTGCKVFAATSAGMETLQGTIAVTTTGGGSLTLTTITTGGAAPLGASSPNLSQPVVATNGL